MENWEHPKLNSFYKSHRNPTKTPRDGEGSASNKTRQNLVKKEPGGEIPRASLPQFCVERPDSSQVNPGSVPKSRGCAAKSFWRLFHVKFLFLFHRKSWIHSAGTRLWNEFISRVGAKLVSAGPESPRAIPVGKSWDLVPEGVWGFRL